MSEKLIPIPTRRKQKIVRTGSSSCIIIPKSWLDYNSLKQGDEVIVTDRNKILTVELTTPNLNKESKDV